MHTPKLLILLAAVTTALTTSALAFAGFTSSASASMNLSSATLAAPTSVSALQSNCRNNQPPQVSISWVASTSSFVGGYTIYRSTTSGSGYTAIGSVSAATTSFTDPSTTLAYSMPYYYVVDSTYRAWTARSTQAQVTTLSKTCQ